jgi:hypothetical protein
MVAVCGEYGGFMIVLLKRKIGELTQWLRRLEPW